VSKWYQFLGHAVFLAANPQFMKFNKNLFISGDLVLLSVFWWNRGEGPVQGFVPSRKPP